MNKCNYYFVSWRTRLKYKVAKRKLYNQYLKKLKMSILQQLYKNMDNNKLIKVSSNKIQKWGEMYPE